ncbi:hypothetical protein F8M41_024278 [Gigaspora margarita]|uniref:Uncharacterized protein n=1 Tax=Gigaspora margarita TaxID=4874 RepID=A0A8H4ABX8_GIGMA|nr:hypothetical protein F8M41_024278 [Gigaspora margarita]
MHFNLYSRKKHLEFFCLFNPIIYKKAKNLICKNSIKSCKDSIKFCDLIPKSRIVLIRNNNNNYFSKISKDITTYFTHFATYSQKAYHESFVTRNGISWQNINFNRSYVIQYSKRNSKEEFDLLQHTKQIPFFEFFVCQCDIRTYLENNQQQHPFYPHLWHYDNCYVDFQCLFCQHCNYFKLLQSVNKSLPKNKKLINMNSTGSLMRVKKQFCNLRPDYEIFLWIKSFDCTRTTQYKNESQLLREFKHLALK